MKFELNTWRELLDQQASENIDTLKAELESENQKVINALLGTCAALPKEEAEQLMHFHLVGIANLGDYLSRESDRERREALVNLLSALLTRLEEGLQSCWPLDARIPGFQWMLHVATVRDNLRGFQQKMAASKVDKALIGLIMNLLEEYLEEQWEMTYRRWYKIRDLMAGFEQGFRKPAPTLAAFTPDPTDKACDLLMQLNLHNYAIFKYLQDHTVRSLEQHGTESEQLLFLKSLLGYIRNNGYEKYSGAGQSRQAGLRTMYTEYLEALIQEKQKSHRMTPGSLSMKGAMGPGPGKNMILTTLSSAELGCMIRLFIDTQVFANENIKQVAEFMALFVGTRKKGASTVRSVNNLYANIYTIPINTSFSVDEILKKMLERNAELRIEMAERKAR